ncbi:hypothetical protein T265_05672 [Opisthorchis viverrini]|uniref:Uncharacterized protein n=1 Tax=Opisthorchis viverrini TaxID=6198 RepID=A0A075AF14_OPIVI|nr:hypothetical protein T265_05672 [Opisthorchis viverrini]KER27269.1 hypothetical protein T265_05672 [Opisthorchis viverrini]
MLGIGKQEVRGSLTSHPISDEKEASRNRNHKREDTYLRYEKLKVLQSFGLECTVEFENLGWRREESPHVTHPSNQCDVRLLGMAGLRTLNHSHPAIKGKQQSKTIENSRMIREGNLTNGHMAKINDLKAAFVSIDRQKPWLSLAIKRVSVQSYLFCVRTPVDSYGYTTGCCLNRSRQMV